MVLWESLTGLIGVWRVYGHGSLDLGQRTGGVGQNLGACIPYTLSPHVLLQLSFCQSANKVCVLSTQPQSQSLY